MEIMMIMAKTKKLQEKQMKLLKKEPFTMTTMGVQAVFSFLNTESS
jgi:hypothetical protein